MSSDASPLQASPARTDAGRRSRRRWRTRAVVYGTLLVFLLGSGWYTMFFPGKSFQGPLPPLNEEEKTYRDLLERHLRVLAEQIGPRSTQEPQALERAAQYLEEQLTAMGYRVRRQEFHADGVPCRNLEVELRGSGAPGQVVVLGAHYDSVPGCPAANDNGTGVASLLALAWRFRDAKPEKTLRFVLFVNEEPPYFQTDLMGSLRYARECKRRGEQVLAMLSLETMGYYRDEPGTQQYPPPLSMFYPSEGNFIGFVGNLGSRRLVARVVGTFRRHGRIPSEAAALPEVIAGVGWSDHWAFWQQGYPALMVTDTAPFRYPYYHTAQDTIDKVDLDRLARVVYGLQWVVADLTGVAFPGPRRDE